MKTNLIPATILAVLLCNPEVGSAQGSGGPPARSVADALERFEQDAAAPGSVSPVGWNWLLRIVRAASEPARIDSVLYGIERQALDSDNDRVRSRATSFLAVAGKAVADQRLHPVLPRLVHIYGMSADPIVRAAVIQGMPGQRPQTDAVAFLKQVATSMPGSTHPDFADEPWEAVSVLSVMGDTGITALRELRSSGTVTDWKARGYLDFIARRGFRHPDA